jgi:hypothetical protein
MLSTKLGHITDVLLAVGAAALFELQAISRSISK